MDNINSTLAGNILKYRKAALMSQDELASRLGITFQAVSKWETGKSAPDISFLPSLADIFSCSIDDLFSHDSYNENRILSDLSWDDDDTIRVFQTVGRKLIASYPPHSCIEIAFPKRCDESTKQYFKVEVLGNIISDSSINGDVVCHGNLESHVINGDVTCQCNVSAYRINGDVSCPSIVYSVED